MARRGRPETGQPAAPVEEREPRPQALEPAPAEAAPAEEPAQTAAGLPAAEPAALIWVGPTLHRPLFLAAHAILPAGSPPAGLARLLEARPRLRALLVPVADYPRARAALGARGSAEALAYAEAARLGA